MQNTNENEAKASRAILKGSGKTANLAVPYQPKTGASCFCKRGIQRDNCPNCEGTGQVIDFAAIRARRVS